MGVKVYSDGFRLILENTETKKQTVLDERRLGFVWPGVKNPGYILVMGLLNEPGIKKEEKVIIFLKEIEENNKERFQELLVIWSKRYKCKYTITNLDRKYELLENSFLRFKKKKGIKDVYLLGSEDFSGFEEAAPIINELADKKNLRIPKNTVVFDQLSRITANDLKSIDGVSIEERYYAVAALNHVISSFEYYPFTKQKKDSDNVETNEGYK